MNHTGRGPHSFFKVTYKELASLFKVSQKTIYRWIKIKKLDPSDFEDIIRLWIDRNK